MLSDDHRRLVTIAVEWGWSSRMIEDVLPVSGRSVCRHMAGRRLKDRHPACLGIYHQARRTPAGLAFQSRERGKSQGTREEVQARRRRIREMILKGHPFRVIVGEVSCSKSLFSSVRREMMEAGDIVFGQRAKKTPRHEAARAAIKPLIRLGLTVDVIRERTGYGKWTIARVRREMTREVA